MPIYEHYRMWPNPGMTIHIEHDDLDAIDDVIRLFLVNGLLDTLEARFTDEPEVRAELVALRDNLDYLKDSLFNWYVRDDE